MKQPPINDVEIDLDDILDIKENITNNTEY